MASAFVLNRHRVLHCLPRQSLHHATIAQRSNASALKARLIEGDPVVTDMQIRSEVANRMLGNFLRVIRVPTARARLIRQGNNSALHSDGPWERLAPKSVAFETAVASRLQPESSRLCQTEVSSLCTSSLVVQSFAQTIGENSVACSRAASARSSGCAHSQPVENAIDGFGSRLFFAIDANRMVVLARDPPPRQEFEGRN